MEAMKGKKSDHKVKLKKVEQNVKYTINKYIVLTLRCCCCCCVVMLCKLMSIHVTGIL